MSLLKYSTAWFTGTGGRLALLLSEYVESLLDSLEQPAKRPCTILVVTFLENIKIYIQEIPKVSREIAQVVTNTAKTLSGNKLFKRASETYRKAVHVITDVTRMTPCNSRSYPHRITNSQHHHTQNRASKQKPYDEYDGSYQQHNSNTPR